MTGSTEADASSAQVRSLARGGAGNLVASGFGAAAGIGLVAMVTRGLSPVAAGVFFTVTSVFLVAARICALGTTTGLVYFIARARALGRPGDVRQWFAIAIGPVAVASVVLAVALVLLAPELARVVGGDESAATVTALRIVALFIPLAALTDAGLAATRGTGRMRPTALAEQLMRPALQLLLTAGAIALGASVALAWALPYLPAVLVVAFWLRRIVPARTSAESTGEEATGEEAWAEEAPAAGRFWRFTGPRALTAVGQVALQRLDIILVAALLGPAEAAVYTAATRFLVVGQLVGQAFSMAVQPKLGAALAREDLALARRLYRTGTCWLVLVSWPIYLSFALFAPAILQLFGPGYEAGSTVVVILTLAMLVATACGMVDTVLNMAGRTLWNLGNVLLALGLNVTVNLVLIPRLGIEGAAIAWAVAILANNLVPLAQVATSVRLHPLGTATLSALALAGGSFGLLPGAVLMATGHLGWTALATALGAALYGAGCFRLRDVLELPAMLAALPAGRRHVERPGGAGAVPEGKAQLDRSAP